MAKSDGPEISRPKIPQINVQQVMDVRMIPRILNTSVMSDWFLSLPSLARTGDAGHRWLGSQGARTFCLVLAIASLFSCKQTGCLGLCTVASEAMGKTIISCVSREPGSEWPFASDEPGLLLSAGNQSSSLCICQIQGKLRLLKSNH